jgi:EPTP domain
MALLEPIAAISTTGARAVETFEIDGVGYLAIPQLAADVPGTPADMNGGDSTSTTVRVLRRCAGAGLFEDFQSLPAPGGEDAELFSIGTRAFLAIASIRNGSGPYDYAQPQRIYEWDGRHFDLFQEVDGYAAKQWRHFEIGGRHFLALAQGVALPGHEAANLPSRIYAWDGEKFGPFADVDSAWGYNWHHLEIDGSDFLAYADHVRPSVLLRWTGSKFEFVQVLAEQYGRAFADFSRDGSRYLAVAQLQGQSQILLWDGGQFVPHQVLDAPAAREWCVVSRGADLYVIRVNFIAGTPQAPVTALESQVYRWQDGQLVTAEEFGTTGGTDVTAWDDPQHGTLVAVSNSLTADVRFAASTAIYRFTA